MRLVKIAQKKQIPLCVIQVWIVIIAMIEICVNVCQTILQSCFHNSIVVGTCSTCYDLHESECRANENCTFCETSGVCMPPQDLDRCPNCSGLFDSTFQKQLNFPKIHIMLTLVDSAVRIPDASGVHHQGCAQVHFLPNRTFFVNFFLFSGKNETSQCLSCSSYVNSSSCGEMSGCKWFALENRCANSTEQIYSCSYYGEVCFYLFRHFLKHFF